MRRFLGLISIFASIAFAGDVKEVGGGATPDASQGSDGQCLVNSGGTSTVWGSCGNVSDIGNIGNVNDSSRDTFTYLVYDGSNYVSKHFAEKPITLTNADFTAGSLTLTECEGVYFVDTTGAGGTLDLNLPDSSATNNGVVCRVFKAGGTEDLTVSTAGGQNVGGAASQLVIYDNTGLSVQSVFSETSYRIIQNSRSYSTGVRMVPQDRQATTIETLDEYLTYTASSTLVSGGEVTTNDAADTVDIAAAEAYLRNSTSKSASLGLYYIPAATGLSVPEGTVRYLVMSYNAGSPQWSISSTLATIACWDSCGVGTIQNTNGKINYSLYGDYMLDFFNKYTKRRSLTDWLQVGYGLAASEVGTRNISVTAGAVYAPADGLKMASALDTSAAGTFEYVYGDTDAGFTYVVSSTQIDNLQYWNSTTNLLTTLANNKFKADCLYAIVGDTETRYQVVYGDTEYDNLGEAQSGSCPADRPVTINGFSMARPIARFVIAKSATSFSTVQSLLGEDSGTGSTPSDHNALSSLQGGAANEYFHHTSAEYSTNHPYLNTVQTFTGAQTFNASATFGSGMVVDGNIVRPNNTSAMHLSGGTTPTGSGGYVKVIGDSSAVEPGWVKIGVGGAAGTRVQLLGAVRADDIYSITTASAANVFIDSGGIMRRSTSLETYKNIHGEIIAYRKVLDLKPIAFTSKLEADDPNRVFYGFGALHTNSIDPAFSTYGDKGEVNNYDTRAILAATVALVQEQESRIEMLEDTVKDQKASLQMICSLNKLDCVGVF